MKKIKSDDISYKTFQDILTGYRLTNILKVAHESDLFDLIGENRLSGQTICEQIGWHEEKGLRFLEALCGMGLVDKKDRDYSLSLFSKKFLLKTFEKIVD